MRLVAFVVALIACVNASLWVAFRPVETAPSVERFESLSFAPYARGVSPERNEPTTEAQVRSDMRVVAPYTRTVRTYSVTNGLETVPRVAAEFGMRVTLGAWLSPPSVTLPGDDMSRNEREIQNLIALAKRHRNIESLVVGNEVALREDLTTAELIEYIRRVRRETGLPVTTGETWDQWLLKPELAAAVDYLSVHILPYWDGVPHERAVAHTFEILQRLRNAFPGKKISIAEFGWPSHGYNRDAAVPGEAIQGRLIREFVARAEREGVKYNIIEAFDTDWKVNEGSVGQYWGLFTADRDLKFPLSGELSKQTWWLQAGMAVLVGFLFTLPIFRLRTPTVAQVLVLAIAANLTGVWFATVVDYWANHYFVLGAKIAMVVATILLVPLVLIALHRIDEIAAIAFGRATRRLVDQRPPAPEGYAPKVSIHIPAYKEPPEMLKKTLDAVARLDYANFECVVIINNTPDPAYWAPVAEHCKLLGDRFVFLNEPKVEGFKAGALRIALAKTAPDAEIIGILDADYVVHPDWLKDLVPLFADTSVGLVQAPQDHRDEDRSVMHAAMNAEYAGFFDVGMVQRNEKDAIVVHGTMCLIRRAAMVDAGNWSSDTICEDSDLGLAIMERGWQVHYTRRRYGWGLLPDTYEAFRKQRHRWAYGGMQIIKKHWRHFLPAGRTRLTADQKREFGMGWLSWLGAESVGVLVAILNLLWLPFVLYANMGIPQAILTVPILATFVIYVAHFVVLYRLRVATTKTQVATSAVMAMSVQFTVAKAVWDGIVKDHLGFNRTAKGGAGKKPREFQAFWEAILAGLLVAAAVAVWSTNWHRVLELDLYAAVLAVQSLPFLAAVGVALLEGSRFNELALWSRVHQRLVGVLPALGLLSSPRRNRVMP